MNRLLTLLLLLFTLPAFAAEPGASGWTCHAGSGLEPGDGTTGDPTIDSGANRRLVYVIHLPFAGSNVISVFTVGGQTFTEVYNHTSTNADSHRIWMFVWDEADIASMSGNTVSFTDDNSKNTQVCWTILVNTEQTALAGYTDSQGTGAGTSDDVDTTSSAGDYIIVPGMSGSDDSFSDWDTLAEIADNALGGSQTMGLGAGDGGDNTTTVTVATSASLAFESAVFLDEPAATTDYALMRRRGR